MATAPRVFHDVAHWAQLVDGIQQGDQDCAEALYVTLLDNARAQLNRTVAPQSMEDRVHDVVLTVFQAIHAGSLREPERLMGFVRTIARRGVAAHIRSCISTHKRLVAIEIREIAAPAALSPERVVLDRERTEGLGKLLHQICARDREILIRFYFKEQEPAFICGEMHLTATQFRLYKSRAIARCSRLADLANGAAPRVSPPSPAVSRIS